MLQELSMELAQQRDFLVGIAPFVVGIFVVAVLILAVVLGLRVRAKEPPPPQEPQPRQGAWETEEEYERGVVPPNHGPGHQDLARPPEDVSERVEHDEVPRNGIRRMPYELGTHTHPAESDTPPKWSDRGGSSHGTG